MGDIYAENHHQDPNPNTHNIDHVLKMRRHFATTGEVPPPSLYTATDDRSGFPEGWDRDETKQGMFVEHRCSRCSDGAKPCPNGQTGPSRNCEHPHARND